MVFVGRSLLSPSCRECGEAESFALSLGRPYLWHACANTEISDFSSHTQRNQVGCGSHRAGKGRYLEDWSETRLEEVRGLTNGLLPSVSRSSSWSTVGYTRSAFSSKNLLSSPPLSTPPSRSSQELQCGVVTAQEPLLPAIPHSKSSHGTAQCSRACCP